MNNKIRDINKIAFPILLNYLLSLIFEIFDKAIVGHYSVTSFAAVGIAANLIYNITGTLGILSAAFNIIAAENIGKNNEEGFAAAFKSSKMLSLILSLLFFVLSIVGGKFFFQNIYGVEENTLNELLSYFYPASFTVFQNMMLFQYSVMFRNLHNTKIVLYQTAVSTLVNLFFDNALVYGKFGFPEMGAAGAAWGSIIGLAAGHIVYLAGYFKNPISKINTSAKNQKASVFKILKLYFPLLGQDFLSGTFFALILSGAVSRLGERSMAVYSLLDSVNQVLILPAYAYATAAQTYSLQKYSAKLKTEAKAYLKVGLIFGTAFVSAISIIFRIFPDFFIKFIISDETIISYGINLLWIVIPTVIVNAVNQILMNFIQGAGCEKQVFILTAVSSGFASCAVIICGIYFGLKEIYMAVFLNIFILTILYLIKTKKLLD